MEPAGRRQTPSRPSKGPVMNAAHKTHTPVPGRLEMLDLLEALCARGEWALAAAVAKDIKAATSVDAQG